jgi:hypothetical protein
MDMNTASAVGLGGGATTALFIAYKVFQWVNHRHFRSECCGKVAEGTIDVDTPPTAVKVGAPPSIPVENKPSS